VTLTEAEQVWQQCLILVRDRLTTPASRTWFEETKPVALSDDAITLRAPNAFIKEWLEKRYRSLLNTAIADTVGRSLHVEIVTPSPQALLQVPPVALEHREVFAPPNGAPADADSALIPRHNFENFVPGPLVGAWVRGTLTERGTGCS
jgi:chromosomal replication initiator protein